LPNGWGGGERILDIGCRDSILIRYYAKGNTVVGLDIDYEALLYSINDNVINKLNADIYFGLPFHNNVFDAVICGELLEHVIIPDIVLSEIKRVLKKDGKFIGSVPLVYHLQNRLRVLRGKRLDNDPTHTQHFSYDYLIEKLSMFFNIKEIIPIEGQRWAKYSMRLFARHVAFLCVNK
jgi:SAM-dependent methyltransferase